MCLHIFDELFRDDFLIDWPPDFPFYVAGCPVLLAPCDDCSDMYFEYHRGLRQCVPAFYVFDYSKSEVFTISHVGRIVDF